MYRSVCNRCGWWQEIEGIPTWELLFLLLYWWWNCVTQIGTWTHSLLVRAPLALGLNETQVFKFFLKYNFIYLFFSVLDLRCCRGFFCGYREWRLFSSCGVWASCHGLSCGAWTLGTQASLVGAPGLWSSSADWTWVVSPGHVGSSWTSGQTCVCCTGRQILYHWATRFLMSQHRENSVRDSDRYKVGLFTEKHTPQIDHGPSQKERTVPGYGLVSFCRGG